MGQGKSIHRKTKKSVAQGSYSELFHGLKSGVLQVVHKFETIFPLVSLNHLWKAKSQRVTHSRSAPSNKVRDNSTTEPGYQGSRQTSFDPKEQEWRPGENAAF